jgi:signal transduction histidine kinase
LAGVFENDLKDRKIDLIVDTPLPPLQCEKARLRQVFQNLIDNAIKYMGQSPDHSREIHVGCAVQAGHAEFYVRDTGMGIDADEIDKVFFVFRRGKNPVVQSVAGKGVGLSSVKTIVEMYSGTIWVKSRPGEGSTFYFTIDAKHLAGAKGLADGAGHDQELAA